MHNTSKNLVLALLLISSIALGLMFWGQPAFDPDLGWHLFGGEQIARTGAVPRDDQINSFSTRWHDYHWLAQLLMFKWYSLYGYIGLSIALGVCMSCIAVILALTAQQMGIARRSPLLTLALLIFTHYVLLQVTSVRPQALALALIALSQWLLLSRRSGITLPILFLLTVLCANIHIYWIFIPVLYLLHEALPKLRSKSRRDSYKALFGMIFLSLAPLLSPYGLFTDDSGWIFENYALVYDYLVLPTQVSETIGELQGGLASSTKAGILILIMVVVTALGFRRTDLKTHTGRLLAALLGLALSIHAYKFVAILAVIAFPYLLVAVFRCLRALRNPKLIPGSRLSLQLCSVITASLVAIAIMKLPVEQELEEQLYDHLPLAACSRIAELDLKPSQNRSHVRIMTHFNYGGWCRWIMKRRAPERDLRVTIDGRTQWFPPEFFIQSMNVYNARYDWMETLKNWSPDAILVSRDRPLANFLALAREQWHLEYEDPNFAVFVPKT